MRPFVNLSLMLLLALSARTVLGSQLVYVADQQQQNDEHTTSPDQQTPPATQGHAASSAAVQSVTGCLTSSDHGYSLNTGTDTYPIETDQDLSKYVNKQIRVTGILEHHRAGSPEATSGNATTLTDLRLRMIASVIGDCPASK